jgi:hypothetical protein
LALREEHRLKTFENRVLMRIFGPKRCVTVCGWRTLHKKSFITLIVQPSIIRAINSRRMRCAGHVARIGGKPRRKKTIKMT